MKILSLVGMAAPGFPQSWDHVADPRVLCRPLHVGLPVDGGQLTRTPAAVADPPWDGEIVQLFYGSYPLGVERDTLLRTGVWYF